MKTIDSNVIEGQPDKASVRSGQKPRYMPAQMIRLSHIACGSGQCESGSGATSACDTGTLASGGCSVGNSASMGCSTGYSPFLACSPGSSP